MFNKIIDDVLLLKAENYLSEGQPTQEERGWGVRGGGGDAKKQFKT
jgi:hypothetical protein